MSSNLLKRFFTAKFFRWSSKSLLGNIVLGILFLGGGTFFLNINYYYNHGLLTQKAVIHLAFASILGGVIFGILIWFALTRPLMRGAFNLDKSKKSHSQKRRRD